MTGKGCFIVVEGLEGAGKSTAIHTIKSYLASQGIPVLLTREPGGTQVGEIVRTLIKEPIKDEPLDDRTELLLLYAARTQLLERVIRPAIDRGTWVIADRFELSTVAYQGGGRHLDQDMIARLSQISLKGFKPDLIMFLDIKPEDGLKRVAMRGKSDRIECEPLSFFNDVYQAYHQAIKEMDTVALIDASQSMENVQQNIMEHLTHFVRNHAPC